MCVNMREGRAGGERNRDTNDSESRFRALSASETTRLATKGHVPSPTCFVLFRALIMSSFERRVILGADGTFLLLFACDIPLNFGKQVKACRIP